VNLNDYQKEARKTAVFPSKSDTIYYVTLGLVGEAGEVAEKVKKLIRNEEISSFNDMNDEQKRELMKELGDVLWYMANFAEEAGCSLEEVAQLNLSKLQDRQRRGVLKSAGDNR